MYTQAHIHAYTCIHTYICTHICRVLFCCYHSCQTYFIMHKNQEFENLQPWHFLFCFCASSLMNSYFVSIVKCDSRKMLPFLLSERWKILSVMLTIKYCKVLLMARLPATYFQSQRL